MRFAFILTALLALSPAMGQEPAAIPVGLDAYRMWDRWPMQRIGCRAYMRSTYDRRGGNEGADASHFLYQTADDFNVALDLQGAGLLCFVRYNHWHGSPWHFVVDGTDHVVRESSTADPNRPAKDSVFEPRSALPNPLTWTWSQTKGADLSWVPIGFTQSFQMAYSRTHYGTGYYIYQQFVPGTKLSQPIDAWDGKTPPHQDVLDLISRAGTDISEVSTPAITSTHDVPAQGGVVIAALSGAQIIRALEFTISRENAIDFSNVRLRITWDDRSEPSVDTPIALFYGAGTLYNRDDR